MAKIFFRFSEVKVEAEAGLHHHPVHCAQQVDVHDQEHNVLPLVEWHCPVFQDLKNS